MRTSRAHSYVPKNCGYTTHKYTGITSHTKPSPHSFKTDKCTTEIKAAKMRNHQNRQKPIKNIQNNYIDYKLEKRFKNT